MADLTFSQLRAKLDTRLSDTSNTVWDSNTKDEFVITALNDPYVYIIDRDKTLTTVYEQPEYTVPSQFNDVVDIAIDTTGLGYGQPVDPSAYSIVNGIIVFDPSYISITGGNTMIVTGKVQLDKNSIIPNWLQEYVLELSIIEAYKYLTSLLGSQFLTNDMTMAQLIQKIQYHEGRAERLRATLQNKWSNRA